MKQRKIQQIKAELKRSQKDVYNRSCRDLHIPERKRVYVEHPRGRQGQAERFIRRFVLGHVRGRDDLLNLKHLNSGEVIKAVSVEKVVVVSEGDNYLRDDEIDFNEHTENSRSENQANSDISKITFHFGKHLLTQQKRTIVLLH